MNMRCSWFVLLNDCTHLSSPFWNAVVGSRAGATGQRHYASARGTPDVILSPAESQLLSIQIGGQA